MSSESNIEIVRRFLEQGFGGGDLSIFDEYIAPDFVEHQDSAQRVGPETVKGVIRGLQACSSSARCHGRRAGQARAARRDAAP